MLTQQTASHLGRLHILGKDEIHSIFHLPNFTDEERSLYFSLTQSEIDVLTKSRSVSSKLDFILQLGYFKARHSFFNFEFQDVSDDVEFVSRRHFPHEMVKVETLPKTAFNTATKHRRLIAQLFNYQFCGQLQRKKIEQMAESLAKISGKPIYIFRELFSFLQTERIILPSYSFLQKVVSRAVNDEQRRLQLLLQTKLTELETGKLETLLDDAGDGFYEITNLKREPRDFSFNEMRSEIERHTKIKEIYLAANKILPGLEISNQSIAYYAALVSYYRVDKLKRFDTWTTYLYLLCFVHQRALRLGDNLINCLLHRVKLYADKAKEAGEIKLSSVQLETNQSINKAAAVLKLMTSQDIPPETPFGVVQQQAFAILQPEEINYIADHLAQESSRLDEIEFRWTYLDTIAARFKLNLRPILTNVNFTDVADNSDLIKAINFLRSCFKREQSLATIKSVKFPVAFIAAKHLRYLYAVDKKSKQKQIRPDRYEFLVYQALAHAIQAGDVNCRESLKFRSFEDDLLNDEAWRQKEILIEKANLSVFKQPVEIHLQELEEELEERLSEVNRRIAARENEMSRKIATRVVLN